MCFVVDKPVYALFGQEPYVRDGYKRAILKDIENTDFNVRTFEVFSEETASFLSTMPLFGTKKVALVTAKSFKELADPATKPYLEQPSPDTCLVFFVEDVDKRTAAYKEFQKKGWNLPCEKLTEKQLKGVLLKHIQMLGGSITEAAYRVFLEREAYFEREDVTVYTLISDLEKLVNLDKNITEQTVSELIQKNLVDDTWSIAKMIQVGDLKGLMEQAEVLSGEQIRTLSALLREYRIAYKAKYFPKKEIGVTTILFEDIPKDQLTEGIRIITDAIAGIKAGHAGNSLKETFLRLVRLHGDV